MNPIDRRIEDAIAAELEDVGIPTDVPSGFYNLPKRIRLHLQREGLAPRGELTQEHVEHPMALDPLGEIDWPRYHSMPG